MLMNLAEKYEIMKFVANYYQYRGEVEYHEGGIEWHCGFE